jgi:hypothetical protein
VIAAHNGRCRRLSSRAAPPPGDEIVQAPVIARRRSDGCEGSALLRNRFDAHDAEKLVKPSPSVGGLFRFKPSLQCRLLCRFSDATVPGNVRFAPEAVAVSTLVGKA